MKLLTTSAWPPTYSVRKSTRARHVHLKISPDTGLEVVLPHHLANIDIEALLLKNKRWIEKRSQKILITTTTRPEALALRAINQNWKINYIPTTGQTKLFYNPDFTVSLVGNVNDSIRCNRLLKNWLNEQGKCYFMPLINTLSETTQLRFKTVSIRNQKTLWGSCSNESNINLNHKLIFLYPHLVRYVILHELCHTKHLNHSKDFWQLVACYDPNYQQHRLELKEWGRSMNEWGRV